MKKLALITLLLLTLNGCWTTGSIIKDVLVGAGIIATWELVEYGYDQGYVEQEIDGEAGE